MSEVRSRLVSKVADEMHQERSPQCKGGCDCRYAKVSAEVAVRTVCDLIADEIEKLDVPLKYDGQVSGRAYRACRKQAIALVRSLGQP